MAVDGCIDCKYCLFEEGYPLFTNYWPNDGIHYIGMCIAEEMDKEDNNIRMREKSRWEYNISCEELINRPDIIECPCFTQEDPEYIRYWENRLNES